MLGWSGCVLSVWVCFCLLTFLCTVWLAGPALDASNQLHQHNCSKQEWLLEADVRWFLLPRVAQDQTFTPAPQKRFYLFSKKLLKLTPVLLTDSFPQFFLPCLGSFNVALRFHSLPVPPSSALTLLYPGRTPSKLTSAKELLLGQF